ncbi:MAG: methyltransferase domain-containing protein [Pyrinomonadaceae bacterium]|nr:methyltransferase domain-containing protein [Pyrinomonadaceae bacterium]
MSSQYLHGTDPDEQRRLSLLNDILNESSLRELNLQGDESILDVGCGLAQFTRAMARSSGARVLGIEREAEQLKEARRQAKASGEEHLIELRQGDALALPLDDKEWGTFDVAHTRFVLEHVSDPLAVVRQMVRAVRSGGRVVLEDDNHDVMRFWPEPAEVVALWNAYVRTYEHLGNDPYVGHRLVSLLHEAGATPVRNTWIFFGSCAGHPHFHLYIENIIGVFEGARSLILDADLLDQTGYEAGINSLRAWANRPDAALWLAVSWAEGRS